MALSILFDINIKAEYYAINILARDALSAHCNTVVIVCVYLYVRPTVRLSVPWTPAGMGKGRPLPGYFSEFRTWGGCQPNLGGPFLPFSLPSPSPTCLLYTSDAADE